MTKNGFNYNSDHILCCDGIPLSELEKDYETPLFVYSAGTIIKTYKSLEHSLRKSKTNIHYAMKANSTLGIISLLADLGSGADIVSGGELKRALAVKIDPKKIIFSGVGKTENEIKSAIKHRIKQINAESLPEVEKIISMSKELRIEASVALRVNPDIEVNTHEKIATGSSKTKFGLPIEEAIVIYKNLSKEKYIKTMGLAIHIGSQIFNMKEFEVAYKSILKLADFLRKDGLDVPNIDLGGGLGVDYKDFSIDFDGFGNTIHDVFSGTDYNLSVEPGRSLIANSGILLTRILYVKKTKEKTFLIVDGGMNDFIRPTLYEAHHNIQNIIKIETPVENFDVVGPICETGDYFAKNIKLNKPQEGDLLAIHSAGAYGSVMSSSYNSRPPAGEIIVFNKKIIPLRNKQTIENQMSLEHLPSFN